MTRIAITDFGFMTRILRRIVITVRNVRCVTIVWIVLIVIALITVRTVVIARIANIVMTVLDVRIVLGVWGYDARNIALGIRRWGMRNTRSE